jgi:hypothetical protein
VCRPNPGSGLLTFATLACCNSYLGFGLMAARAATLDWEATAAANPCVPLDHTGSFEYGNKHHELHAAKQGCAPPDASSRAWHPWWQGAAVQFASLVLQIVPAVKPAAGRFHQTAQHRHKLMQGGLRDVHQGGVAGHGHWRRVRCAQEQAGEFDGSTVLLTHRKCVLL